MPKPQPQFSIIAGGARGMRGLPSADVARMVALLVIVEIALLVGLRSVFRTVHGG